MNESKETNECVWRCLCCLMEKDAIKTVTCMNSENDARIKEVRKEENNRTWTRESANKFGESL